MDIALKYKNKNSLHNNLNFSKPNFKFIKIVRENNYCGLNDIFEVFASIKRKDIYLASSNPNYNLDIISIKDIENCKVITSLKGHLYYINFIKYFKKEEKEEYLISADKDRVIIIWDIINDFSKYYKIETYSSIGEISCALICFNFIDSNKNIENYIIFSFNRENYTNIHSLYKKKKIREIKYTNTYNTNYLVFWENKNTLFELSEGKIFMYNREFILDKVLISDSYELNFNFGFIYNDKNENDCFIFSSSSGNIYYYNLVKDKLISIISINNNPIKDKNCLCYFIQWSNRYVIACDYYQKGFKVIDLETSSVIDSISNQHKGGVICAKKIYHPNNGECLLTAGNDEKIILWNSLSG